MMVKAKINGLALDVTSNSPVVILAPEESEKVLPIWIGTFNQVQLPRPFPIFQSLLTQNGRFHIFMKFIPYQLVDTISFSKSLYQIVFVFPYPFNQV